MQPEAQLDELHRRAVVVNAAIAFHEELEKVKAERDAAVNSAARWRRIAESGSRAMLSVAAVLGAATLGLIAVVILWLRVASTKGAC